MLKTELNQS